MMPLVWGSIADAFLLKRKIYHNFALLLPYRNGDYNNVKSLFINKSLLIINEYHIQSGFNSKRPPRA